MSKIDLHSDPTLIAVDKALVEQNNNEPMRGYIGMSSIGGECLRKVYFDFHWCSERNDNATTVKKFLDGHCGEAVQAERLRLVPGITLHTHRKDGKQFEFFDLDGHFSGHIDGAILGLLQAPKTWHCWEHKQVDQTEFNKLKKIIDQYGEKQALKKWSQTYYSQAMLYLKYSGMKRHYLTVSTPGNRETISVRTEPDSKHAKALAGLAHNIIVSDKPQQLERCSDSPAWYVCKSLCSHSETCHGKKPPLVHCRTCAHSTPHITDSNAAVWRCHLNTPAVDIPLDKQRVGCESHLYNPALLQNWAEPIDASPNDNTITYMCKASKETFTNGNQREHFTSKELSIIDQSLLADKNVLETKRKFNARVIQ